MLDKAKLIRVDDYHEFSSMEHMLRILFPGLKFRVEEIGFDGHDYVGMVYDKTTDKDSIHILRDAWRED